MRKHSLPKISIGLPVFNGESLVARAIDSILGQLHADFELIVSDNASTDSSGDIVREFAQRDTRIRYHRQHTNIGPAPNFGFVLREACSEYFMWAAADDYWTAQFVEENLRFLVDNPDYVSSISRARFFGEQSFTGEAMGTFPLRASTQENLYAFLMTPAANSRFYAVHRTDALRAAWINEPFWANDWAIVCRLLQIGKFNELPEVMFIRNPNGASSSPYRSIRNLGLGFIPTAFPYLRFTRNVCSLRPVRSDPRILAHLLWLNLDGSAMMLRHWILNLTPA